MRTIRIGCKHLERVKQPFYNPIWQNNTHIKHLHNFINDLDRSYYKSIIVFGDDCSIKKMNVKSENVTVINTKELESTLSSLIKDSKVSLSLEKIEEIYLKLKPCTLKTEEEKIRHVENIKKMTG